MFSFFRSDDPNKVVLQQIAATLGRINIQLAIMIAGQNKLLAVWDVSEDEDGLEIGSIANSNGELNLDSDLAAPAAQPEPVARKREPTPTAASPQKEAKGILWQPLKADGNKALGWSMTELLNKNSRSMESLLSTYSGWTQDEILEALNTLVGWGLVKSHVRRTSVKGVSAMRRIYKGAGQSWEEYVRTHAKK